MSPEGFTGGAVGVWGTTVVVNDVFCDLQYAPEWFAAECKAARIKASPSKSEAMTLNWKTVQSSLQVSPLPQTEEFKYLWILFMSEGKMEQELNRWIGASLAVMRALCQSVIVKTELSRKAKLSLYQAFFAPTLTYGHHIWAVTERMKLQVQVAEITFLWSRMPL